jgi:CYTH domain-containing protein
METKKTKLVISEEAKLRAKNYMRLKDGYVETKQERERGITITHVEKQETLEEFIKKSYLSRLEDCLSVDFEDGVKLGAKWIQEQIGKSKFLQKLRGTLSDAEARRLIFETFKNE